MWFADECGQRGVDLITWAWHPLLEGELATGPRPDEQPVEDPRPPRQAIGVPVNSCADRPKINCPDRGLDQRLGERLTSA